MPMMLLLLGEMTALAYIGMMAKLAALFGIATILFPELAALAYDVFTRPKGVWARAVVLLVVTPTLTAVLGIVLERFLGYEFLSVFLCVLLSMVVISSLKSPVAPAISAGLLPLVLNERAWVYPASVLLGTALLALGLLLFRRALRPFIAEIPETVRDADDVVEELPRHQRIWLPFFMLFLLGDFLLVRLTGSRYVLYPPLVVIAYEMFAHSEVCPWAPRPGAMVLACTLMAAWGVMLVDLWGINVVTAILVMAMAMGVIRWMKLHAPPAASVGLLPFVIAHPDIRFPVGVAVGTIFMSISFSFFQFVRKGLIIRSYG